MTFSIATDSELPEKLPKLCASKSGQKSIQAKSSGIPSSSAGTSKTVEDPSSVIPVVSEGAASVCTPPVVAKPSTITGVTSASDAGPSEDFDLEQTSGIESTSNVSDNTSSGLVITNVRSVAEMSSSEQTNPSKSGGISAEDLPPLELNKCLHVSIEHYPNLLKHLEEGKVRIKKECTQDVRLTAINCKKVTAEVFSKFYNDNE